MSSEHNLPPELTSFEAKLRTESLADSRVNRDELMYQAGWAAAESARKTGWLWPTTSSVLAASVLVLAGLLVSSPAESPEDVVSEEETIAVAEPTVSAGGHARTNRKIIPSQKIAKRPVSRWASNSPFLVMRERALRMEFDEPVVEIGSDDDQPVQATTARQLMLEMLGETS